MLYYNRRRKTLDLGAVAPARCPGCRRDVVFDHHESRAHHRILMNPLPAKHALHALVCPACDYEIELPEEHSHTAQAMAAKQHAVAGTHDDGRRACSRGVGVLGLLEPPRRLPRPAGHRCRGAGRGDGRSTRDFRRLVPRPHRSARPPVLRRDVVDGLRARRWRDVERRVPRIRLRRGGTRTRTSATTCATGTDASGPTRPRTPVSRRSTPSDLPRRRSSPDQAHHMRPSHATSESGSVLAGDGVAVGVAGEALGELAGVEAVLGHVVLCAPNWPRGCAST